MVVKEMQILIVRFKNSALQKYFQGYPIRVAFFLVRPVGLNAFKVALGDFVGVGLGGFATEEFPATAGLE